MSKINLVDEEIELIAKALTAYKKDLRTTSVKAIHKDESEFCKFEIARSNEIAKKLGITE